MIIIIAEVAIAVEKDRALTVCDIKREIPKALHAMNIGHAEVAGCEVLKCRRLKDELIIPNDLL